MRLTGSPASIPAVPVPGSQRTAWADLPGRLRVWVENVLGEPVTKAHTAPGGFSPGAACRVRGAGGRRAFVKAISRLINERTAGLHRREAALMRQLTGDPDVPALLGSYDDGDWVALVMTDVAGASPATPWRTGDLEQVLGALAALHARHSPARVGGLPSVADRYGDTLAGWRRLAAAPPDRLDDWSRRHLDMLVATESAWAAGAGGDALLHGDLRADNLLRDGDRVVFVDWAWACIGAPWFDVVALAPSVAAQGGPAPGWLLDRSPSGRQADPAAVTAAVVAVAGYFTEQAGLPAPPGLLDPRPWQDAQAVAARAWIRERTG